MPTTGPIILGLQMGPSYYVAHNKYCILRSFTPLCPAFCWFWLCGVLPSVEFVWVLWTAVCGHSCCIVLTTVEFVSALSCLLVKFDFAYCGVWGRLRCVLHDYCGTSVLSTVKFVKFYSAMSWHLRSLLCGVYCEVWLRGVLPTAEEAGIII